MKKMSMLAIALLFLSLVVPLVKAGEDYYWAKSYGGSGVDVITDVKVLPDGSIIAAGYTNSSGSGKYDVLVMKLSPEGKLRRRSLRTRPLEMRDFEEAFKKIKSPLSKKDVEKYERWAEEFGG